MDRDKYLEKGIDILTNEENFKKLATDPTKSIEGRIQRTIRKLQKQKKFNDSE